MVDKHFRWDFIGLSTDVKPTPATSSKVVNGSTYYTSDNSKLYVWYKDQWYEKTVSGGGTTYTAGDGIVINEGTIGVDLAQTTGTSTTKVMSQDATTDAINGIVLTGSGAPTTSTPGTVGQLYEDTTNGKLYQCTDASDPYVWSEVGGGGGGDSVYSSVTTSNSSTGGAVYIGNIDSSQTEQSDPTTADSHYKYFWALPKTNTDRPTNGSINILGTVSANSALSIGSNSTSASTGAISMGYSSTVNNSSNYSIAFGYSAEVPSSSQNTIAIGPKSYSQYGSSVALGAGAHTTRVGEVNIGTTTLDGGGNYIGFNNTAYRVLGGLYDGQSANDAVTVSQVNSVIDAINTALSTNIPHIGA